MSVIVNTAISNSFYANAVTTGNVIVQIYAAPRHVAHNGALLQNVTNNLNSVDIIMPIDNVPTEPGALKRK